MAHAVMVVGLGWGDEGKGSIVDYLTKRDGAKLVVRYNGGAQAAHNVVLPDGRHHTFSQWGSGSFHGAHTYLSKHVIVNPFAMENEARALAMNIDDDPWELMHVDTRCLVTTPFHVTANRIKEMKRGRTRHGSCGMGVGETVGHALQWPGDELRVGDIARLALDELFTKLERIAVQLEVPHAASGVDVVEIADRMQRWYRERLARTRDSLVTSDVWFADWLGEPGDTVIFEGAQGVLLDQTHGFPPHHTWSDCTLANALELVGDNAESVTRIGVLRSYATRHGAGPLPTEHGPLHFDNHNSFNEWQGPWRIGDFDVPLTRYAAQVCPVDQIALTHVDRLPATSSVCVRYADRSHEPTSERSPTLDRQARVGEALVRAEPVYERMGGDTFASMVERVGEAPVSLLSAGPTFLDKCSRRSP